MTMIKCVVFDIGDTLIATTVASKKALKKRPEYELLKKHGFEFSRKQIHKACKRMIEKTRHLPEETIRKDFLIFARTLL